MLRCSTLIFTIAFCFVCIPDLLGQAQYNTGFPARLSDALETEASRASTKTSTPSAPKTTIQNRPWLGEAPVKSTFAPKKSTFGPQASTFGPQKSTSGPLRSTFDPRPNSSPSPQPSQAPQPKATPKQTLDTSSKGTPFKPQPNYKKFQPQRSQVELPGTFAPSYQPEPGAQPGTQSRQQSSFSPPSITPQPKPQSATVAATPVSQEKAVPEAPVQPQPQIQIQPEPKLADIDPNIRREIEEQVKRDLEKKFETQIQDLVQKQVRDQVKQARLKMERAARNARIASRPLSSSTYRPPGARREAPSITGEVLPLIVPGNSKPPAPDQNHARYLITDSVPGMDYQTDFNSGTQNRMQSPPADTTRREPQPVRQRLRDGAQSKPASNPISVLDSPEKTAQSETTSADLAKTESSSNEQDSQNQFLLRTSVIGPEALLKDQSDDYEISISNITNRPATNVIVQLSVPDAITISRLDRDAYLDQKQRTVSWKVSSIGAGQKEVIRYRAVSSSAGQYKQEVTLGMEDTFQGTTPFTTVVQIGAPQIPNNTESKKEHVQVAERLEFED